MVCQQTNLEQKMTMINKRTNGSFGRTHDVFISCVFFLWFFSFLHASAPTLFVFFVPSSSSGLRERQQR
jgi:hypothetical protein